MSDFRMPPDPIDRDALVRNLTRAELMNVDGADFLVRHAAEDLAERLDGIERRFADAAILDPPDDAAVERIRASERVGDLRVVKTEGDGRVPLPPTSCDLVVSLMTLHLARDVPGTLAQIARALRPDGLFIAALPGGETLRELREAWLLAESEVVGGASPRVIPFVDVRDAGALLQRAGLALPVADVDRLTVRYADPLALMRELRAMGMSNPLAERSRRFLSRAVLLRLCEIYAERHADPDGRIRVTHDIVSLAGWKPHESQQKPLRPGEGKTSLADVLGSRG